MNISNAMIATLFFVSVSATAGKSCQPNAQISWNAPAGPGILICKNGTLTVNIPAGVKACSMTTFVQARSDATINVYFTAGGSTALQPNGCGSGQINQTCNHPIGGAGAEGGTYCLFGVVTGAGVGNSGTITFVNNSNQEVVIAPRTGGGQYHPYTPPVQSCLHQKNWHNGKCVFSQTSNLMCYIQRRKSNIYALQGNFLMLGLSNSPNVVDCGRNLVPTQQNCSNCYIANQGAFPSQSP